MDRPIPTGDEPEASIFIVHFPDTNLWHAVWSNQEGFVADFDAQTEQQIVTWARQRCDRIWIWSPEKNDYVRLPEE